MKRKKFIALAVVVALMLMGAVYAVWTDTVKVSTTVQTGNVDVSFIKGEEELTYNEEVSTGEVKYYKDNTDGAGDNTLDKAVVTFTNIYPGAKYYVSLKMKNYGTLPVQLDELNQSKWSAMEAAGWSASGLIFRDKDGNKIGKIFNPVSPTSKDNEWTNIVLPPGGTVELYIHFVGKDSMAENATYTFEWAPTWKVADSIKSTK